MTSIALQEAPSLVSLGLGGPLDLAAVPSGKGVTYAGGRPKSKTLHLSHILGKYAAVFQTNSGEIYHVNDEGAFSVRKNGIDTCIGILPMDTPLWESNTHITLRRRVAASIFNMETGKITRFPSRSAVKEIVIYDIHHQHQELLEKTNLISPLLLQYNRR